jgi:hypothetical protein
MRSSKYVHLVALFLVLGSAKAGAQPPASLPYEPQTHCTSLSLFGGVATPESASGALLGGTVGWQITPRVGLEGFAMWLDLPHSETGFSAAFSTHVDFRNGATVVPYLAGGMGIYHAAVDMNDHAAPTFYTDRFMMNDDPGMRRTFTDLALLAGGGVAFFLSPQLALRPQADVMFVVADDDTRVVPVFTLHLVYHFRDHPITPSRK